ncbi:hypothetical protein [Halomonas sp. 3H]|uniref:hypothetical protein n=1 Tax=Halomonas sp. 3H TaxID=2952527 RepID=UPI0020B72799|nr:hypothetical protein [Halomonas sp. 3H]
MSENKPGSGSQLIIFSSSLAIGYAISFIPTFLLIVLLGSFETAKSAAWYVSILPALILATITISMFEDAQRKTQETNKKLNSARLANNFSPAHKFASYPCSIEIDETTKRVLLQNKEDITIIEFNKIIDVELFVDDSSITSLKSTSGLKGAVAGGLLLGGVGAIVGAIATKNTSSQTNDYIEKVSLKVSMKSFSKPFQELILLDGRQLKDSKQVEAALSTANEWAAVLAHCIRYEEDFTDQPMAN